MKSLVSAAVVYAASVLAAQSGPSAETYKVDPVHSTVLFRAKHAGASYTWGRFNDPSGTFVLDPVDPARSSFSGEIQVANIDTHNEKRDAHLRSPDFFNAKQYPTITFKSTSIKKAEGNVLHVTGDLRMHGVTRSVSMLVELTGAGEFPPGTKRAGLEATFVVKMSDFEIKGMPGVVSDEIKIIIAVEGVKQ